MMAGRALRGRNVTSWSGSGCLPKHESLCPTRQIVSSMPTTGCWRRASTGVATAAETPSHSCRTARSQPHGVRRLVARCLHGRRRAPRFRRGLVPLGLQLSQRLGAARLQRVVGALQPAQPRHDVCLAGARVHGAGQLGGRTHTPLEAQGAGPLRSAASLPPAGQEQGPLRCPGAACGPPPMLPAVSPCRFCPRGCGADG